MPGKCRFQKKWLNDYDFKLWLLEAVDDPHRAFCKLCKHFINLSATGVAALRRHRNGKTHSSFEKPLQEGTQSKIQISAPKNSSNMKATLSLRVDAIRTSTTSTSVLSSQTTESTSMVSISSSQVT